MSASKAAPAGRLGLALKDALIATVVAMLLFVPLVALRTDIGGSGGLTLRFRWKEAAILCGLVFLGRLALVMWTGRRGLRPSTAPGPWTDRLQQAGAQRRDQPHEDLVALDALDPLLEELGVGDDIELQVNPPLGHGRVNDRPHFVGCADRNR